MLKTNLTLLLQSIYQGTVQQKYQIKLLYNAQYKKILDIFIKEGLIFGYKTIEVKNLKKKKLEYYKPERFVYITLKFNKNILLSRTKKKLYLDFYKLKSLIFKNKNLIFVISTTRGILSNTSILKNKIGGQVLFTISY